MEKPTLRTSSSKAAATRMVSYDACLEFRV